MRRRGSRGARSRSRRRGARRALSRAAAEAPRSMLGARVRRRVRASAPCPRARTGHAAPLSGCLR
eukprot:3567348-Pleurochrysis_carterae.AAC.6